MPLTTSFAGAVFSNPLMNASGIHCGTEALLEELKQSGAATYVTKSATLAPREGNPDPRYATFGHNSINSMGLPNEGIDYYLHHLSEDPSQSTRFLSISPLQIEDLPLLADKIIAAGFTGLIELNLSCPNVVGKPQIGYDFEQVDRYVALASDLFKDLRWGVKLPPYLDLVHMDQIASILNQYPLTFVNTMNSLGNGLVINDETTLIHPKQGHGGIGGPSIKPIALSNVHGLYTRLNPSIAIIGTGGISNGRDVFEHILCGATLVQLGTILAREGVDAFDRIAMELATLMSEKGYQSVDDFRGKLRYADATDATSGASSHDATSGATNHIEVAEDTTTDVVSGASSHDATSGASSH